MLGLLIAAQQSPIAKGDKVTAWREYEDGCGHYEPGVVRRVNRWRGTYDVEFDGKRDTAVPASKILESKGQLLGYEPQQDGSHLKLGVQPQGLLMLLEEIGFIYWDGESEGGKTAEEEMGKYSLRVAGRCGPYGTGWRYTKLYSRGDFPAPSPRGPCAGSAAERLRESFFPLPLSSLFLSPSVHDSTGQCRQVHEHARCNLGHVFVCSLLSVS